MSQVEKILTKIESIVENANKTNSSNDKDTGTNDKRDEIIYDGEWVYKDVYPKFKLKDDTPEFSYHLLYHYPSIPDQPLRPKYAAFPWLDDQTNLEPVID